MEDNTGYSTPDDDGADDALAEAEQIIDDAATDEGKKDDFDADEAGADDALTQAEVKAAEHLADLQRLQAEYVNYRKRVDRDRLAIGDVATAKVLEALLPVLDDIAAARQHGDLAEGPFASIAEKLEEALGRFGWSSFGAEGETFDPALHEALMSQPSADVSEPTVQHVAQPGHRLGERVVRAARVIVAQPADD
ncbi:nucleotide exchange factor GrpE [Demequina sp. TTPB684]|uniref:nucleotide exchange factor GrpE n=1 Tax=unclassified Demequina TaxID=2620311 RepID=UPI001CF2B10A|nr:MULTISPECIES: nucleotide exchange factor GrpE [unclassified Demequina]MCB2413637.1 nucleotide exchange factor GrpE [Demequina sp. TTPB684]UPU88240.1 nucleotide exchange factor GrpE [Demequina sp. TMPB413]